MVLPCAGIGKKRHLSPEPVMGQEGDGQADGQYQYEHADQDLLQVEVRHSKMGKGDDHQVGDDPDEQGIANGGDIFISCQQRYPGVGEEEDEGATEGDEIMEEKSIEYHLWPPFEGCRAQGSAGDIAPDYCRIGVASQEKAGGGANRIQGACDQGGEQESCCK